jgi:hypothetical protein
MAGLFRRTSETFCGVLIDISSGSVAAAIVLSEEKKPVPEIVFSHRKFLPMREAMSRADHLRATRHALFNAMLELEQRGMKKLHERGKGLHVQKVFAVCSAPWAHTATQLIHFEREMPFVVTRRMVDDMIAHACDKEKSARADPGTNATKSGFDIVEKVVADVTLNGYSVADPYGKQASEITVTHLRGLVANSIASTIEEVRKHTLDHVEVRMHTAMLVMYCVLRDLYPRAKNALIVLLTEETTEIGIMQNHILYESAAAGEGVHAVIRDLARLGKTVPEEAHGYLRAYRRGVLSAAQEKALAAARARHVETLRTLCDELNKRYVLPQTVLLITEPDTETFFTDALKEATKTGPEQTEKHFVPLSANTKSFAAVPQGDTADLRISLIARFFHKLHSCGDIDNEG